jgi:hypothetical protein
MKPSSCLFMTLVGLGLAGLASVKANRDTEVRASGQISNKAETAKSSFSLRVLDQSDNMKCSVQSVEGSSVLRIAAPDDADRIMVIRVEKTNTYLDANDDYHPVAGPGKPGVQLYDPRFAEAFEFDKRNMRSRKVRMFNSDGRYDFLLAESFEEAWEYEFPEAWCKVEVWRR